jgi:hypothetical protein
MRLASASMGALVAACALGTGCHCSGGGARHDPVLEKASFGDLSGASGASDLPLGPYIALARAVVAHQDRREVGALPPAPGRRVFLTVFPRHAPRVVRSALGDTLESAVTAAAEAVPALEDTSPDAFRVELDVVREVRPFLLNDDLAVPWAELGMTGYALVGAGSAPGYVLPGEVLLDHDFVEARQPKLKSAALVRTMEGRAGFERTRGWMYQMRTQAAVDPARRVDGGARALNLLRGAPERDLGEGAPLTSDALLESVRLGADYLARVLDPNGRYIYEYRPSDDHPYTSYELLRHCGSTYALLEAYEELHTPLYLEKAEAAIGYFESKLIFGEGEGGPTADILDVKNQELQKVGGAGLALIALAKHLETTGKHDRLGTMQSLARLIVDQQYPDGHFRANADLESEGKAPPDSKLPRELVYYMGEAALGLMRLFRIDHDVRWLDSARKVADYVIDVRDANTDEDSLEHDHWMSYAFNELYRETKNPAYMKHAYEIARAILKKQHTAKEAPAPDFVGAFYPQPQATPASTRLEALDADMELSRFAGKPDAWLMTPALAVARFTRAEQLDADALFWASDPDKALGGVRESLFVGNIRIDYVQHAISSWLHLARLLRDPAYARGVSAP